MDDFRESGHRRRAGGDKLDLIFLLHLLPHTHFSLFRAPHPHLDGAARPAAQPRGRPRVALLGFGRQVDALGQQDGGGDAGDGAERAPEHAAAVVGAAFNGVAAGGEGVEGVAGGGGRLEEGCGEGWFGGEGAGGEAGGVGVREEAEGAFVGHFLGDGWVGGGVEVGGVDEGDGRLR